MKIGILTLPPHYNYGGIIQNWALQQVLIRLGHKPVTIRRTFYGLLGYKAIIKRRAYQLYALLTGHNVRNIHSTAFYNKYIYNDEDFVLNRIIATRELYTSELLSNTVKCGNYEAFILGSDQVWREEYSPCIENFFLDFLPDNDTRPKIAYAASFGVENGYITPEKMPACRRLLSRFDAVSVREDEGLDILRRDFGRKDAVRVLDPTLLLEAKDYETIISHKDRHKDRFVGAYILDDDSAKQSILGNVASHFCLPVQSLSANYTGEKMPTVSQWLALFADADFIVTDSFHGCVFSIIFGKPFIAIANRERGLGRFSTLLSSVALSDRLIFLPEEFDTRKDSLLAAIDYTIVRERLSDLRKLSVTYLTTALV